MVKAAPGWLPAELNLLSQADPLLQNLGPCRGDICVTGVFLALLVSRTQRPWFPQTNKAEFSSPHALSSSPLLFFFPLISFMPGTYYVLLNTDCPSGTTTPLQALCPGGAIAGMSLWGWCCLHSVGSGTAAPL